MSLHRSVAIVLALQFMNGLGFGLIFTVSALFASAHGLSPAWITAVIALHPIGRWLTAPVWGRISDRIGRKPVLVMGTLLQAIGHLLFAQAASGWGLAIGRAIVGMGAADSVANAAMIADLTPIADRAERWGWLRASGGIGMLMGAAIGAGLGIIDLRVPLWFAAGLQLLATGVAVVGLRETLPTNGVTETSPKVKVNLGALGWVAMLAAAAIALAENVVVLALGTVTLPAVGIPPGWTTESFTLVLTGGVILAFGLTLGIFDAIISARWIRRWGTKRILLTALPAWSIVFLLTPWAYGAGIVPGAIAVIATAVPASLVGISLVTLISRQQTNQQGEVFGVMQRDVAIGECIGPAVAGVLFEYWFGMPYLVAAIGLFGCWILLNWRTADGYLQQDIQ